MTKVQPRGIRNCNPLNLRKSSNPWQGKITPGTDSEFEQFTNVIFGLRAAMVNLRTYIMRYHVNTVAAIIEKWAPRSENSTSEYIKYVCKATGYTPDTIIIFENQEQIVRLVHAMAQVECGQGCVTMRSCYAAYMII